MSKLNILSLFSSLAFVAFGLVAVAGCAADTDEDTSADQGDEESEEVASSEAAVSSNPCVSLDGLKEKARARCRVRHESPKFGSPKIQYQSGGAVKRCEPGTAVSIPYSCR